jgi:uncharacterized membrane protein
VIACAVGDAVVHGTPLLRVYGAKAPLTEKDLMRAIRLEFERTPEQDPKYPLRLLVDIALRALSAAINDPTTAVQAIDQIEDLLRRLGRCEFSAGFVKDADGTLRLVFPIPSWDDYLTLAFDEIRQCGASSVQVTRRLRSVLVGLADWVTDDARARAVQRHMKLLDVAIDHSELDTGDQEMARLEDRQGLGVSRRRPDRAVSPSRPTRA